MRIGGQTASLKLTVLNLRQELLRYLTLANGLEMKLEISTVKLLD